MWREYIACMKFTEIHPAISLMIPYKLFPFNEIILKCRSCFLLLLHFRPSWACMNLRDKYSICTYTQNLLISSWISIKFVAGILLCMHNLWNNFQLKASTWMCLRRVSTLLLDSHNMNHKQMISIKFQIHKLYWCMNLQWKFKEIVMQNFFKLTFFMYH